MSLKYSYSQPWITNDDRTAVARILNGTMLTRGEETKLFEDELATAFGAKFAVVCNTGTAALHLAYLALGLGPERNLLTAPITFLATANAAKMVGADVLFCDVDPATGLMDPAALRVTLETAENPVHAIAPIHLAGRSCDMSAIKGIADEFNCRIIEDAAHAPGALYRGSQGSAHPVGACHHSDALIFSFHAVKHIAMGEGGALLTNDPNVADKARLLRNHGMSRNAEDWQNPPEPGAPWYYEMQELGWNYHVPDILCALGRSQLQRLEEGIRRRTHLVSLYEQHLREINYISLPPPPPEGFTHVWHLYPLAVDFTALDKTRSEVMEELAARGVGTQVHYTPLYHHPYYRETSPRLPGTEAYYANTLSIPLHPELTEQDISDISGSIKAVICSRDGA